MPPLPYQFSFIQTTLKKVPVKVVMQNNTVVGGSSAAQKNNTINMQISSQFIQ
jgi:hypothetical protein